jgi:hypothetical protein
MKKRSGIRFTARSRVRARGRVRCTVKVGDPVSVRVEKKNFFDCNHITNTYLKARYYG